MVIHLLSMSLAAFASSDCLKCWMMGLSIHMGSNPASCMYLLWSLSMRISQLRDWFLGQIAEATWDQNIDVLATELSDFNLKSNSHPAVLLL
jgi:hypothetical protein